VSAILLCCSYSSELCLFVEKSFCFKSEAQYPTFLCTLLNIPSSFSFPGYASWSVLIYQITSTCLHTEILKTSAILLIRVLPKQHWFHVLHIFQTLQLWDYERQHFSVVANRGKTHTKSVQDITDILNTDIKSLYIQST
jgi:hypothetical protein